MKIFSVVLILINLAFCGNLVAELRSKSSDKQFFVGTYTDGESKGIYSFTLNPLTGKLTCNGLAAQSNNPSFLALTSDRKFLLAVHETRDGNGIGMGYIESFLVQENSYNLTSLGKVSSGGAHPCYVSVNQKGYVLAANYSGGNVALLQLDNSGKLSKVLDIQQHYGSGPNKARQSEPHVHSAFFEPGTDRVLVPDLGIDKVVAYQIVHKGPKMMKASVPAITMPPGSGPRHLAFHPTLHLAYVVNELSSSVSVVSLNKDESFTILETVSALPEGYEKSNTCADIHLSKDGEFLYASNRGLNTIAIFTVDPKNGKIVLIGQEPTRGETPRNFTLSPDDDFLLVANQNSQDIVAFRRDVKTGLLKFTDQVKAFKPVCLLFR